MAGKQQPSNSNPQAAPSRKPAPVDPALRLKQWRAFQIVIGIASLWWLILIVGVLTTANPPTFEAFLVEQSDFIVEAKLDSPQSENLVVSECWNNPIRQANEWCAAHPQISRKVFPAGTPLQSGVNYLLPLKEVKGNLRWLSAEMYTKHGSDPQPPRRQPTPILATDLTRRELRNALQDIQKPLKLDAPAPE